LKQIWYDAVGKTMRKLRTSRVAHVVVSDPDWEGAKAARGNIGHDDGVQETAALQAQFYALWGHRVAVSPVDLNLILRTFAAKKVPFVLTGAHGIGGWTGRPRATKDLDILVKFGRNHARAVKVIEALYPQLEVRTFFGATAFFVPGERESVIDITYPHRPDLEATLANAVWTENEVFDLRYRVPSLEAALANKYGAMITPTRDLAKRQQDAVDFTWIVIHSLDEGQQTIDLPQLEALGEKVWSGGGPELLHLVEQVKAGRPINIEDLGSITKKKRR
jgi:hypothetical protein